MWLSYRGAGHGDLAAGKHRHVVLGDTQELLKLGPRLVEPWPRSKTNVLAIDPAIQAAPSAALSRAYRAISTISAGNSPYNGASGCCAAAGAPFALYGRPVFAEQIAYEAMRFLYDESITP
jgi:hypothetical protein